MKGTVMVTSERSGSTASLLARCFLMLYVSELFDKLLTWKPELMEIDLQAENVIPSTAVEP